MEYSAAFDADLAALEAAAIDLAERHEAGPVDATDRRDFVANIDHLVNTYPLSFETVRAHAEHIKRMYRNRTNENTVRKRIDTEHQAFVADVCDDYDPQF
ncbi:hypothetical protein [Halobellus marinus]|uniref:hypothetical protein n=1 Tax=Halobellus TaxID=1073986 RepID=UPI0028A8B2A5|nr:hypothetical protein [Halobellus sp. DFY28]